MIEFALILASGVAVWFGLNYRASLNHWQKLAGDLGLSVDWGGPLNVGGMSGTYNGMSVQMRLNSRLSTPSGHVGGMLTRTDRTLKSPDPTTLGHTTYKISFDGVASGLSIVEQGIMAKLGKLLGAQDVEVGLPAIDDAFVIKADNTALAREILRRQGLESALMELRYKTSKLQLSNGTLHLRFDSAHRIYEVSAHLAKLTNLMKMLAAQPPVQKAHEPTAGPESKGAGDENVGGIPTGWW
jgi:hypothetical protein